MASKRLIANILAEKAAAEKYAGGHESIAADLAAGNPNFPAYGEVAAADEVDGHVDWWMHYMQTAEDLARFLALAREGQPDSAIMANGYDPAQYKYLRA